MNLVCYLLLTIGQAAPEPADAFVYVSVAGEQRINVYRMAAADGALNLIEHVKLDAEPGALAISRDRKLVAAALRSSGQLAVLRRDPESGKLALVNVVPAGPDPAYVALDASGRFLFTAYYVAAKVTVHAIGDDGRLGEMPVQSLTTAEKAHAVVLSPDERFVFVPHTGAEAIFQFAWNAERRELSAVDPPRVTTSGGTGPRHLVFHPRLPLAYVDNEQGNSVTAYRLDAAKGTLQPEHTEPSLPGDFKGGNSTAEIRIHPSGKFLYCTNRGHDSLARFSLEAENGKLKFVGTTPTEKTPRSFDLDPTGRFLFAAGEESDKLACYRIEEANGDLHRIGTVDTGRRPWWVQAVPVNAPAKQ